MVRVEKHVDPVSWSELSSAIEFNKGHDRGYGVGATSFVLMGASVLGWYDEACRPINLKITHVACLVLGSK